MIVEGKFVDIHGVKETQIEIKNGLIKKIGKNLGKADFSFENCTIFPGFVDVHVHARQDVSGEQNYKEDFLSASKAAINGGVVAFVDMPNNPVAPVDKKSYEEKKALASNALIPIYFYAGIGPETKPFDAKAYKVFMGPSVGQLFFKDNVSLDTALNSYQNQNISFHCEDPFVLEKNKNKKTHEEQRPAEAEIEAIKTAVNLIKKYSSKGKICHVSTKKGVEILQDCPEISIEITPHHLFFDIENKKKFENNKLIKMNPPIREKEDREALFEALKSRKNICLATDHAPHTLEEKQSSNPSGVPHLDTYGNFVCWLISKGVSLERIAEVCCFNPGKFLEAFTNEKYGLIKEGYVASFSVLNLNKKIKIEKNKLKTKCKWSPFEGFEFPGKVEATIVKGKVYFNGDV